MIFVLTIINNVNNICKNENHWSFRDREAIFGLRGPNAELPTGRETGWGSEFTGLRQ